MTIFNNKRAFEIFSNRNLKNRLSFLKLLKDNNFNFAAEEQPEAWIQHLLLSTDTNGALSYSAYKIFIALVDTFGINTICSELSACYGCDITILDAISFQLDYIQNYNPAYNLPIEKNILLLMHHMVQNGAVSGDRL
jgi:hypothetical protein